jgi:hypothetical protein
MKNGQVGSGLERLVDYAGYVPGWASCSQEHHQTGCVCDRTFGRWNIHLIAVVQSPRRSVLDVCGAWMISQSEWEPLYLAATAVGGIAVVWEEIPHCRSLKYPHHPTLSNECHADENDAGV